MVRHCRHVRLAIGIALESVHIGGLRSTIIGIVYASWVWMRDAGDGSVLECLGMHNGNTLSSLAYDTQQPTNTREV